MQHLTFAKDLTTETLATEYILHACRANEGRKPRFTFQENGLTKVTFTELMDGTHEACLRNADGVVVALANVDEFDI